MNERGAPTTVDCHLFTGIAHAVDLIAIGMSGVIGDVKFTIVVFARIEVRTAETTQKDCFAGIDKISDPTRSRLRAIDATARMFIGLGDFSDGKPLA